MIIWLCYFLSFIFFASPVALYFLFKKEQKNIVTILLIIIFILKFAFDLLFYYLVITISKDFSDIFSLLWIAIAGNVSLFLIFKNRFSQITLKKELSSLPNQEDFIKKEKKNEKIEIVEKKESTIKNDNQNLENDTQEKIFIEDIVTEIEEDILQDSSIEFYSIKDIVDLLKTEYIDTGRILNFEYQGTKDKFPLNRTALVRNVYKKNNIYYMDAIDLDNHRLRMFRIDRISYIDI